MALAAPSLREPVGNAVVTMPPFPKLRSTLPGDAKAKEASAARQRIPAKEAPALPETVHRLVRSIKN
jgi:hypothetical protein